MKTKEELQEISLLTRQWEAACQIQHPTTDELNLRIAIGKKLGLLQKLGEMRSYKVEGPVLNSKR